MSESSPPREIDASPLPLVSISGSSRDSASSVLLSRVCAEGPRFSLNCSPPIAWLTRDLDGRMLRSLFSPQCIYLCHVYTGSGLPPANPQNYTHKAAFGETPPPPFMPATSFDWTPGEGVPSECGRCPISGWALADHHTAGGPAEAIQGWGLDMEFIRQQHVIPIQNKGATENDGCQFGFPYVNLKSFRACPPKQTLPKPLRPYRAIHAEGPLGLRSHKKSAQGWRRIVSFPKGNNMGLSKTGPPETARYAGFHASFNISWVYIRFF